MIILHKKYSSLFLAAQRYTNPRANRIAVLPKLILSIFITIGAQQLCAQDSSGTKQEVWPEVNLFYKFNDKFRFYANYSATKLKNSSYTDGGFGAYLDYFGFPVGVRKVDPNMRDSTRGYYLWLRVGYMYSTTPSDAKDPFKLHTIVTELNLRFHLPYHILLTNKNRFDWRVIDGQFEPRYRPRLTFEKDLQTAYLYFTPNIYGEYYAYLNEKGLNRFRLSAGVQTKVTKHIEFETYYVHQFANSKGVKSLDAMGLVLKFYFSAKKKTH